MWGGGGWGVLDETGQISNKGSPVEELGDIGREKIHGLPGKKGGKHFSASEKGG